MKAKRFLAAAIGWAWISACAFGQSRAIQPSPAYFPSRGAGLGQPGPAASQPAMYAPPPARPYSAPQPAPRMTLAPLPVYAEEEEEAAAEDEGLYWFWGQKWPGIALGPKIGTTGIGADLTFGINRFVNLRGGFNYGSFTWSTGLGSVDYDMDVDLISVPLLVDLHPFANHFRISGGLYFQPGSQANLNATPGNPTQIGAHVYPPEVIGTLSGEIEVASTIAPYLGIGFGNAVGEDQMLTFMVDFGVIFQSYDSSLTSDGAGMTAKLDTFRKDMELEAENLQKDLDDFKIFPVLTFGIAYHF